MEATKEKVLTASEICEVIKDYAKENIYKYALLLDGKWGCGKSYYVTNTIKELIEQTGRKFVYISLYGVSSLDILRTTLLNAYLSAVKPRFHKNYETVIALSPALNVIPLGIGEAVSKIGKHFGERYINRPSKLDECFFVFDDLERCSVLINDVLGYINNLIEHNDCKVLIVANEEECGHLSAQVNNEMKYIAAALLKEYVKSGKAIKGNSNHISKQKETCIDLTDIHRFADELFEQNELYQTTKEKLIGKTIKYVPQLETIIPEIVQKVYSDDMDDRLNINKSITKICIDTLKIDKITNLRILQYSLAFFKKIHNIVQNLGKDIEICKTTLEIIMNAILKVSVRSRVKNDDFTWSITWNKDTAFDNVDCLTDDSRVKAHQKDIILSNWDYLHFFSFRFIHNYIQTGAFDHNEVINDLTAYIDRETSKKMLQNDPYEVANQGWWSLSEKELLAYIEQMEIKFLGNEYSSFMCLRVLHLMLYYSQELKYEIGHPNTLFEWLKNAIITGLKQVDLKYDNYRELRSGGLKGIYADQFNYYITSLQEYNKHEEEKSLRMKLNKFDIDNWSSNLRDTVLELDSNKQVFISRKAFAELLDIDTLLSKLERADGEAYSDILGVFRIVYHFQNINEYYSADIPNLDRLIKGMQNITFGDKMITRCRDYVIASLVEFLRILKNEPKIDIESEVV